jgi:putative acetyltransferase
VSGEDAMAVAIERATAPDAEIVELLAALDADLSGPYAPDQHHALSVEKLFQPDIRFFVVRRDQEAVACGGIGFYAGYAELKRMYAKPEARGSGIAAALLARLEAEARDGGAKLLTIETGIYQLAAMRFYEKSGFIRCGAFGPYAAMPPNAIATSAFYQKAL